METKISLFVCFLLFAIYPKSNSFFHSKNPSLKLWYTSPSNSMIPDSTNPSQDDQEWVKSLPLGNGFIGAMVFGDVNQERIQLNEKSLWSGSPQNANNLEAAKYLDSIRQMLFKGDYKNADVLTRQTQRDHFINSSSSGQGANLQFGCFQTLGDLWLDFNRSGEKYESYQRELQLETAIAKIQYIQNGILYQREVFTNYATNVSSVLVLKMTANKTGAIDLVAFLNRTEKFETKIQNDTMVMEGQLDDGNGGKGMKYMAKMKVKINEGSIYYEEKHVKINKASEIILYLSAATDYLPNNPNFSGNLYEEIIDSNLENALKIPYDELKIQHIKAYSELYARVNFYLDDSEDIIPTDIRLKNYQNDPNDLYLEQLSFQYGRYLLISSSHPNSVLPANLQGIWANKVQTPWNGDYHTDINVQMNYWLAEVTNLAEVHLPLLRYIEMLSMSGQQTAREQYNKKGWVLHTLTNIWGFTSPGEDPQWGLILGLTAWMCQHLWEHYLFNLDRSFLAKAFPIMLQSGVFYLDWLVKDPMTGKLVSGPTASPENSFISPDLITTSVSMGTAHDQETIYNLFGNIIDAAQILEEKSEIIEDIKKSKQELLIPSIGPDGRLMEWSYPFQETDVGHRHMSHLWGLYPGNQINNITTPELYAAAQKSLEFRLSHGGGSTGWSSAWTISLWARLKNGDKARVGLQNNLQRSSNINLFDECPPFQIDGNFGNAAGVAELLLQSHLGFLEILPALPFKWEHGIVKGLKGRGGFEVDIKWEENQLEVVEILSQVDAEIHVKWKNYIKKLKFKAGERKTLEMQNFENWN